MRRNPCTRHKDLVRRLKRIEGQARGVQRMIEEDRPCGELLVQLSAMNEAIRSVSLRLAEDYALECLENAPAKRQPRKTVATLLDALVRAPR